MNSEPGALLCASAPVEDQMRSSSILRTGRSRGREPVAMNDMLRAVGGLVAVRVLYLDLAGSFQATEAQKGE